MTDKHIDWIFRLAQLVVSAVALFLQNRRKNSRKKR
jgi:hypothetical protein